MHSVEDMYHLINDVLAYPEFLPECSDSKIIAQDDHAMTAAILVSKGGLKKWFTTENILISNQEIKMNLVDGPFKQLVGGWQLKALSDDACKIELTLDYEFSNKMFDLAFGRVFNNLANNMVQAFTQRAKAVYG
tara:strand:+ start:614 stop:1015 length:402 start_codon:yes stop_codon:yes gene_type:complete